MMMMAIIESPRLLTVISCFMSNMMKVGFCSDGRSIGLKQSCGTTAVNSITSDYHSRPTPEATYTNNG